MYEPEHYIVELTLANWYMIESKQCIVETDYKRWVKSSPNESHELSVINVLKALQATRKSLDKVVK